MTGMTKARVLPEPVTACGVPGSGRVSAGGSEEELADLDDDVLVLQEERYGSRLDRCHLLEAHVAYDVGAALSSGSVSVLRRAEESAREGVLTSTASVPAGCATRARRTTAPLLSSRLPSS